MDGFILDMLNHFILYCMLVELIALIGEYIGEKDDYHMNDIWSDKND